MATEKLHSASAVENAAEQVILAEQTDTATELQENDSAVKKTAKKQNRKSGKSIEDTMKQKTQSENKKSTEVIQNTIAEESAKKSKSGKKVNAAAKPSAEETSVENVAPVKSAKAEKKTADDAKPVAVIAPEPEVKQTATAKKSAKRKTAAVVATVPEEQQEVPAVEPVTTLPAVVETPKKQRKRKAAAQPETETAAVTEAIFDAQNCKTLQDFQNLQAFISKKIAQMQNQASNNVEPAPAAQPVESTTEDKQTEIPVAPKKSRRSKKSASDKEVKIDVSQTESAEVAVAPVVPDEPAEVVEAQPEPVEAVEVQAEAAPQEVVAPKKKRASRKSKKQDAEAAVDTQTEADAVTADAEQIQPEKTAAPETEPTSVKDTDASGNTETSVDQLMSVAEKAAPEILDLMNEEALAEALRADQAEENLLTEVAAPAEVVKPKKKRGRKPKSALQEERNDASDPDELSDKDLVMLISEQRASVSDKKNAKALAKHASLTKNDTMKQYMGEIGVIPLVSKDQEVELASQIHGDDYEAQEKARETLIMANLRLVVKIAHDFKGLGLPLLDLISEGNLGLMRAVMKFDPEKGAKFSSYAAWWIKQSMRRALANQSKTIRIPVQSAGKINKIKTIRQQLSEKLGREPTDAEIADELAFSQRTVAGLRLADLHTFSLHDPIQQGEEGEFQDIIPDRSAMTPERILGDEESKKRLKQILDELDERERQIIRMRFGLDYNDGQGMTLEEVSQRIGRTRERVRQIQNQALAKLRNMLSDEAGFNND